MVNPVNIHTITPLYHIGCEKRSLLSDSLITFELNLLQEATHLGSMDHPFATTSVSTTSLAAACAFAALMSAAIARRGVLGFRLSLHRMLVF